MNPLFLSTAATTALQTIAEEPAAALSGAVAKTVEASSGWLDVFTAWVDKIDGYVWGVPLIAAILVTGLLLTCALRLNHLFNLKNAFRYMFHTEEGMEGDVSSFGALCTALSATIGTGNIVGVATAIGTGGPGALFWMELAAFFGMATKYAEGLLAVKYREFTPDGRVLGGPFYYIEKGLGKNWKWLAALFAIFGIGAGLLGIGTITQVHGITSATQRFFDPNFDPADMVTGIQLFGTTYSLPVVIAGAVVTLATALVVTGAWEPSLGLKGVDITIEAFSRGLSFLGPCSATLSGFFLMVALTFFAFTTILGWNYYSEKCLEYLVGPRRQGVILAYRCIYVVFVALGPYLTVSVVWGLADTMNGLMAFPNLVALVLLSPVVWRTTKDFLRRTRKV